MANVRMSQADKDYLLSGLDMAIASCKRLAARTGQLPFAVEGYVKEGGNLAELRMRVTNWPADPASDAVKPK